MLEVTVVVVCPECGGAGKITLFTSIEKCPKCNGTGKAEKSEPWPNQGEWTIKGGG
jgi:DnaJ-class molecular chaperone